MTTSTYRLQLRGDLDLARVRATLPYLAALGIDCLYLSPIATSSPESTHGYDVIDPTTVDPAIGGRSAFDELVDAVQSLGMGILLDLVPNHMRAHADNTWWRDVLEHGQTSAYAGFFDLRWGADPERRLVLPVLGRHYGEALEAGEIVPQRDHDGFVVRYFEMIAPFDPRTWDVVLDRAAACADRPAALVDLAARCRALPSRDAGDAARDERARVVPELRRALAAILADEDGRMAIDAALAELAGTAGKPPSFDALHGWLDAQAWRLAYWRSGLGELNYRRFFDVSELVALRSERDEVFAATHALVAELVKAGAVVGLRIDHVDGLADPRAYLGRVRRLGVPWLVVEKVLCGRETVREDWPCDGTTGYEMLNAISRVFIDPNGAARLETEWRARTGGELSAWTREAKLRVLDQLFAPTLRRLAADLRAMTVSDRRARDVSQGELERALRELTAAMPVYRTYLENDVADDIDHAVLEAARNEAEPHLVADDRLALEFIGRVLRGQPGWTEERAAEVASFVRRWQQLTGPVMAKGVEDTLMYRWVPLLALAEVGGELRPPIDPVTELHEVFARQHATQSAGLCATATHDTKRGEDVRARLCVLTEIADAWLALMHGARAALHEIAAESPADDDEIERLLQTGVGAWPLLAAEQDAFGPRLRAYAVKAAREAKRRTDWLRPDAAYEEAVQRRADALVAAFTGADPRGGAAWQRELVALQQRVAFHGAHNGLAQLVLKLIAPGVCDVYQGTELWDLSLVDPDNRRAVDFAARASMHARIDAELAQDPRAAFASLRERWTDGGIKLAVLARGLAARGARPELFVGGDVLRVVAGGARAARVCAVARRHEDEWALGVVARGTCGLVDAPAWPVGAKIWDGTNLLLPDGAPTRWRDALTGIDVRAQAGRLALGQVLVELPCALLVAE